MLSFRFVNIQLINIMVFVLNVCNGEFLDKGSSSFSDEELTNISNCCFKRLFVLESPGGVIYITKPIVYMSITECLFSNCQSGVFGGAICAIASFDGKFLIKKCKAIHCKASNSHFSYIYCQQGHIYSYYELVSMESLSKDKAGTIASLIKGGVVYINSLNCTNCESHLSGLSISFTQRFWIHYSNFNNCKSDGFPLNLIEDQETAVFSNINFIQNDNFSVICMLKGVNNCSIIECIFSMNTNLLFLTEISSLIVNNCFIFHSNDVFKGNNIQLNNISYTKTRTLEIMYYYLSHCTIPSSTKDNSPSINQKGSLLWIVYIAIVMLIATGFFLLFKNQKDIKDTLIMSMRVEIDFG